MRNIEIKAHLRDLPAARRTATERGYTDLGLLHQIDTYFHVARGRLKLREFDEHPAQLIWYNRPDDTTSKASDYELLEVQQPALLKAMLSGAVGIRAVVDKRRHVFLDENVRIHLDEVANLGTFFELEAVLSETVDATTGHQQVAHLEEVFSISAAALIAGSYLDLIEATASSAEGRPAR